MEAHDVFWRLEALSDRQLLERMGSVLGSSRRLVAELIAHLGEVEERRLHLVAACSSMFAYCLKLGMTEDEAYRRIEVMRLARRYPAIFPLLANGELSISVVALLKHHLSDENHLELLASVSGKSVARARELIAARFPRPDVPSCVRKLPELRKVSQPSLAMSAPTAPNSDGTEPSAGGTEPNSDGTEPNSDGTEPTTRSVSETAPSVGGTRSPACQHAAPPRVSSRIEPLSAQRYKVQLTASAELARKLELARDLMRHSHPGGELGPIVERALDLLIESLLRRRFGKRKQASPARTSERVRHGGLELRGDVTGDRSTMRGAARPDTAEPFDTPLADATTLDTAEPVDTPLADATTPDTAEPVDTTFADVTTLETAEPTPATYAAPTSAPLTLDTAHDHRGELTRASATSYIPRSSRRTVMERDGLGCGWVDESGVRCGSRAWLEYDHRHPRAKGGAAEPDNLRILCRSHNRLAAERAFGREHVEHAIAERRRARAPHGAPAA